MSTLKEIKERINSISSTRKITSAMMMVSASKLSKAQQKIAGLLPYSDSLHDIFRKAILAGNDIDTPLARHRETKRVALVAFSSDNSLAGAFNSNVIKELRRTIDKYLYLGPKNIYLYTIGKKVNEAAAKWECPIVSNPMHLAAQPDYDTVAGLAMELAGKFAAEEIDKVELIYHHFKGAGSQVLTHEDFLPVALRAEREEQDKALDFIFEPTYEKTLEILIPKALKLKLYATLLDSNASEHAARVIAMQTATDNADNLILELTVQYNKSRQQTITNELLDIMGGQTGGWN